MKCAEEPLVIGDERSFVDVKKTREGRMTFA